VPIYEYKCKKCHKTYELIQGITAPEAKTCIYCAGPVGKLISLSAFHLKGTGWYATDYSGKKPVCEAKKEGTADSSAADGCSGGACPGNSCKSGGCDD